MLKSGAQTPAQSSLPGSNLLQEFLNLLQGFVQGLEQQIEQFLQNPLELPQQIAAILLNNGQTDNPLGIPQGLINFLQSIGVSNSQVAHDPTVDLPFDNIIASILQHLGISWSPADGTLNGLDYDDYADPGQAMFWVARTLELFEDFQNFAVDLTQNPVEAFQWFGSWLFFDIPTHIEEVLAYAVTNPAVALASLPAVTPAALGGLGLAGLANVFQSAAPALAPVAAAPSVLPVVGLTSIAAPIAAPAPGPAPAPTPSPPTPAGPAPSPPPAPPAGVGFVPPYVVGPPSIGFGSGASASASSSAKRKAPEPDTAAAVAAAAAREAARARRRQRQRQRGYGNEFMDMNVDVDPDWGGSPDEEPVVSTVASDHGAGNLGFAGTAHKETAAGAAGLAALASDEFGGGPKIPMVPGSWDPAVGREGSDGANESEGRGS
ncbi:hypothetical protein K3U93_02400 [Mycobacterium malmoense]|nr:hypothetical protein K3U93_02400 [Mycobacterium malmoense]